MSLREMQFHKTHPKLAAVFQTIFDDLIVGREDVGQIETELYSYDTRVKDTVVTVFILRAEVTSILATDGLVIPPEVEVLGFCYPRELEQKVIDVSVNKDYETVFKVPNGIKDLETVEIKNLRFQSPQFAELFSRYFNNEYYYILNRYTVHNDPRVVFAEPTPLTPEQEAEAKVYDNFCLHDLPKYEKSKTTLIKELGTVLERIPKMYGRFRLKRKEVNPDNLVAVSGRTGDDFHASDYEERKVDHDLYFTFIGDKVDDPLSVVDFIDPAFIRIPYYMDETESRVLEPLPFKNMDMPGQDGEDGCVAFAVGHKPDPSKTVDLDLYPTLWKIEDTVAHANNLVHAFIKKWNYHPELLDKTKDLLNTFLLIASNKQDLLYTFNDTSVLELHLNRILQRVDEMKEEQNKPDAEWGLDPDSWKLWDYADTSEPVAVPEWHLAEELADHYSESYVNFFTNYVRSVPHSSIRHYTVIKAVPEDQIADHAIGSVRQV